MRTATVMPRVLLVIAVVFGALVLDRLAGWALGSLLSHTWTGEAAGQANYALSQVDRDVIFFGSSRARQHFDPGTVQALTGLRGYNAGANGQNIYYTRALSRMMLGRGSRARLWVINVDPGDVYSPNPERLVFLRPFAAEEPLIVDLIAEWDRWAPIKAWSRMWMYNSSALSIVWNRFSGGEPDHDGFVPRSASTRGEFDLREVGVVATARRPAARARSLLAEIAAEARRAEVAVLLVTSPVSTALVRSEARAEWLGRLESETQAVLTEWTAALDIPYVPVSSTRYPVFEDSGLFADPAHLNAEGAQAFSEIVAQLVADQIAGKDASGGADQE